MNKRNTKILTAVLFVVLLTIISLLLSGPKNQKLSHKNYTGSDTNKKDIKQLIAHNPESPPVSSSIKDKKQADKSSSVDAFPVKDIDEGVEKNNDYFPVDKENILQMLSEIKIENSRIVTKEQTDIFLSTLAESILAYKTGDANGILNSLLRISYKIKPEATKWHIEELRKYYINKGEVVPSSPLDIMKLLVSRRYFGQNGSGYKDLYNELSAAGSIIKFYTTDKLPVSITENLWMLHDAGVQTFKNGVATQNPSIEYDNSPQKVLQKSGRLIYADVSVAASDSQNKKYSRLKRFYWSQEDKTWLPMEIVGLYARQRKADEFF